MMTTPQAFGRVSALILAGERSGPTPLLDAAGVSCKALVPLAGKPLLERVADALRDSHLVGNIWVLGPLRARVDAEPDLREVLERETMTWLAPGNSPAESLLTALGELPERPVLVTTADHALISAEIIDQFLGRALQSSADFVVAVGSLDVVRRAFPDLRKTAYRLRGGNYCGCNLFLVNTQTGSAVPRYWRRVEGLRKRPWRIANMVGWRFLLQYLTRRMTLVDVCHHLGDRMGASIATVLLDRPEASVDIDTPADWRIIQAWLDGNRRAESKTSHVPSP